MINNQNIGVLSEKVAHLESDVKTLALPPVEAADEGKALIVNDAGAWEAANVNGDNVVYSEGVSVNDKITDISTSENLTLSTEKTNGITGTHCIKNGLAFISGYFETKVEIASSNIIGTLNANVAGGTANWVGIRADNGAAVRGYILKEDGSTGLFCSQTLPANTSVVLTMVYEVE